VRDNGMTEFLAKPISAKTIYARLCSVIENPRAFIRVGVFFGPDRRRRQAEGYESFERRRS
jgi:two-component system chemotaxis response regulator CheY